MNKLDLPYILHIQSCLNRIDEYTRSGRDFFLKDYKTQDAVLRNLQTLAESSQKISEDFKSKNPAIPWKKLSGFRNILVHNYLGLNLEKVWDVIEQDIPQLGVQFKKAQP